MARTPESQIAYANLLATELTDLEFETLVRERIKREFSKIKFREELNDHYIIVSFSYSPYSSDPAKWNARIGAGFNKSTDASGEVFSRCVHGAVVAYELQPGNKLSLLLEAPSGQTAASDTGNGTREHTGVEG